MISQQFGSLWRHIRPKRKKQFFLVMILVLIASIMEAVSIGAIVPFLGALTASEDLYQNGYILMLFGWLDIQSSEQIPLMLAVLFSVLVILAGVARSALLWAQVRLSYAISLDLDMDIYDKVLHQSYLSHLNQNSSNVISGMTVKTSQVAAHFIMPMMYLISSIVILSVILTILIVINPVVAIISLLIFSVIYILIFAVVRSHLSFVSTRISKRQNKVIKILQESLGGIRDVLVGNLQGIYYKECLEADFSLRRAQGDNQIIANMTRFGIESIAMVVVIIMAYSLSSNTGFENAIPLLGAFALGAQRVLPILQQIFASIALIKGAQRTTEDVVNMAGLPVKERISKGRQKEITFENCIELRNLSFKYSTDSPWVLRNISMKFYKGERVGIIGASGSGKSTFIDILMGLLEPTEGEIIVDDRVLNSETYKSWQKHIAHVPQSVYLSDSTISENIAFGVSFSRIDMNLVLQAAKGAQISDVIESWRKKYKTIVGENGIKLSGGQRQRIGIARALFKGSDIIILDEATSAVDKKTEASIMRAIDDMDRSTTMFIIAHRLSTLEGCDRIIEVCDKAIVET